MTLTKRQIRKRAEESPAKTRQREKQKRKKLEARQAEDKKISEYLLSKGWTNTGFFNEVWKIPGWERSEECATTLRKAYKIQFKLDASGHSKPAGIDDDLGSLVLGE